MSNPHRIFFTRVTHRRLFPVQYRFVYPVFSLLLDIDAVDQATAGGDRPSAARNDRPSAARNDRPSAAAADAPRRFSVGRRNLFRFEPRDHGPRDGSALRPWAESLLAARGIELAGGRIRLLCFPRVLGYGFNPLSLWYCEHRDGTLRAVLAEVNNTFGEHHIYLLADGGDPIAWPLRGQAQKCFHVSPLMDMQGDYHFRLSAPDTHLNVLIRQYDADGRLKLVATQSGPGELLTDAAIWRAFWRTPVMTLKVMFAIHWQALKIWLRGVPYFPKPEPPRQEVT